MLLVLAFTFLSVRALCDASVPASSQAFIKNIDLAVNTDIKTADVLQQDLRKNNDDYRDTSSKTSLKDNYDTTIDLNRNKIRRADDSGSLDPIDEEKIQETNAKPKVMRKSETALTSNAKREDKVDKMMNFLDKHKGLIKEFMVNHTEAEGGGPRMRVKEERRGDGAGDLRPPSGAQLDMAPAVGGAVQTMRNKNRLCFRHVLIPEGPKYDSRGKVYLAEFRRLRGRDYHQTRPPKLLLPKCCNCCAKSVLGCE